MQASPETPQFADVPKSERIVNAANFEDLRAAVLEKEVLVHPEKQTRIEVDIVVSAIKDVETAIALGATREDLRNKIQAVTRSEGIREAVIQQTLKVRPDIR